ncbi:MAG: 50S ribosomal protein L5 [Candidatus Marsarchaeota archaeon]|nr:50S ribosomal protein L5 [Candidatus Marsarchaeota archaeon]
MRDILVEKVVINIGVGEPGDRLEKAVAVLERITHKKPVKTKAKKSIRDLNVRKGEEIGCKVTLRGSEAKEFIRSALLAVNNKVKASSFDDRGNLSFGIKEHIYLPGVKYDPELGIFGFDVCVRFTRRGLRVSQRGSKSSKIGKNHLVKADEARRYMVEKFGAEVI